MHDKLYFKANSNIKIFPLKIMELKNHTRVKIQKTQKCKTTPYMDKERNFLNFMRFRILDLEKNRWVHIQCFKNHFFGLIDPFHLIIIFSPLIGENVIFCRFCQHKGPLKIYHYNWECFFQFHKTHHSFWLLNLKCISFFIIIMNIFKCNYFSSDLKNY